MPTAQPLFLSYSANHEDVMLNRVFGMQVEGFYVDVGAAHPLFENDTRALYDRGWHGINIEPNKSFFRELVTERLRDLNLNVAVSDEPGELLFNEIVGTGLSTADSVYANQAAAKGFEILQHTLTARTLRSIFEEAKISEIDVLKVDVEGFELRVLRSNDWAKFRPKIILSEGTHPESPVRRDDGVAEYLAGQGYRHVYFDGLNDFYAEHDFAFPPDVFSRPLNVFDRFIPFAESQLARANAALTSDVERLQLERENQNHYVVLLKEQEEQSNIYIASLQKEIEKMGIYIASILEEREKVNAYIASLIGDLRRMEAIGKTQAGDLARAQAETVAMRERSQALSAELDATVMSGLIVERDKQHLVALKSQIEVEALGIFRRLESVYASNSWKITRPLRALARPSRTMKFVLAKLHLP